MTLGGLALAVGILVDDATVAIENIHRNIEHGKAAAATRSSTAREQIAVPAFVSTLSICIVFLPIFALSGPAAALFRPLALAVIFAMAASYFLSRTLVPTMADYMLPGESGAHHAAEARRARPPTRFSRIIAAFDRGVRDVSAAAYHALLAWRDGASPRASLDRRRRVRRRCRCCSCRRSARTSSRRSTAASSSCTCARRRARGSRRPSCSSRASSSRCERAIPAKDLAARARQHRPADVRRRARRRRERDRRSGGRRHARPAQRRTTEARRGTTCARCARSCRSSIPGVTFFFQPADMVNQVLNLGLPAPIDVQVAGRSVDGNYAVAQTLVARDRADSRRGGRARAAGDGRARAALRRRSHRRRSRLGLSQRDVASDLLISLSSSGQTAPNFWLDPRNGVQYAVNVMTPQYKMGTIDARRRARRSPRRVSDTAAVRQPRDVEPRRRRRPW